MLPLSCAVCYPACRWSETFCLDISDEDITALGADPKLYFEVRMQCAAAGSAAFRRCLVPAGSQSCPSPHCQPCCVSSHLRLSRPLQATAEYLLSLPACQQHASIFVILPAQQAFAVRTAGLTH